MHQTQSKGQGTVQQVGGPGMGSDVSGLFAEIRDSLNTVKRDMNNGYARMQQQAGGGSAAKCPDVSCPSTMVLVALLGGQLVIILGYLMFRDSKDNQAKKFYWSDCHQ